jgi:hypothetical protein
MANLAEILNNVVSDSGTSIASLQPLLTNPVTGTGTTNYIPKWSGTTAIGDSQIFDNGTGVGIGNTSPSSGYKLDVTGALIAEGAQIGKADNTSSYPVLGLRYASGTGADIQGYNGGSGSVKLRLFSTGTLYINTPGSMIFCNATNETNESMRIVGSTKNVLIGTTTDAGYKLRVNGSLSIGTGSVIASWDFHNSGTFRQEGNMYVVGTLQAGTISQPGSAMTINIISSLGRNITFVDGAGSTNGDYVRFFSTNTIGNITSGTANLLLVNPTINQTTGAGTIIGYRFNPTNTALVSSVYSFYADSGTAYFGSNVGIGTASPNASALVDITSTTKGFLPPRMTSTQRAAISSPAVGLVIYQTDATEGIYEYTSAGWRIINSAGGGGITGSGTTNYMPVFTGSSVIGNSFIVNDTANDLLKTVYASSDYGLKLDFANDDYYLGNPFSNAALYIQGIELFAYESVNGANGFSVVPSQGKVQLGDYNYNINGTRIVVDDSLSKISFVGTAEWTGLSSSTQSNVLYYNSSTGAITYGAAPTSGYSVSSISTTHTETATSGTKILKADTTGGAFTINLPTAVSNTATIIIKKTAGSGALTVDANSTETIDGGLTAVLNTVGESITLISDNSNWQIV